MIEAVASVDATIPMSVASDLFGPAGDSSPIDWDNQAGTSGVATFFNIIELGTRIFVGLLTTAAVLYAAYGFFLLMRSAGNPQMMDKAKMQIILSLVGAAGGVAVFLLVGTAIDFIYDASGGTVLDVGDVSRVNTTTQELPPGAFLGIYGGEAVLCAHSSPSVGDNPIISTAPDGITPANAEWVYVVAAAPPPGDPQPPDYCKKTP